MTDLLTFNDPLNTTLEMLFQPEIFSIKLTNTIHLSTDLITATNSHANHKVSTCCVLAV